MRSMHWRGDFLFLLGNLVLKDFRIRYRNMSLGVLWSLLNPLVMMGVLTFVFTKVFQNSSIKHFPLFVLCGIVPYNFFSIAWTSATGSVAESAGLVKRVPVPREVVPIAAVLSNCVHLAIQIVLLLSATLLFGGGINVHWLWLPLVWGFEILFVCGLAMLTSALNVYVRDIRYVVESATVVLFWLVPIFYSFDIIPLQYKDIYQLNPVAALVLCLRHILLDAEAPLASTLWRLTLASTVTFGVGFIVFHKLKDAFYEHI